MAKCIICMDRGVLAVNKSDKTDIITIHNKTWSELDGRYLIECECRMKNERDKWREKAFETKMQKSHEQRKQSGIEKSSQYAKNDYQQTRL